MDTKDLIAFIAVYEHCSISSAAKKMFITAQGVSKIVRKLENELEVNLFDRNAHGVTPTTYGESLYQNSQIIIGYLERIKLDIKSSGKEKKKKIRIASTLGVMDYLTVDFILDFKETYHDIDLVIIENPDKEVDKMLQNEDAEIGFIAGPIDVTKYNAEFFTSHKHCLVINNSHPLALKDKIAYKDLDRQPIALEGRNFKPYYNNMNRFLRAGVQPIILLETTEIALTHKIASMNKGIGLSVDFQAWSNPYPNTVIKPFEDIECVWNTYLVYKKEKIISPEVDTFRNFAFSWLEENKDNLFKWTTND